jgi:hypothetical protein
VITNKDFISGLSVKYYFVKVLKIGDNTKGIPVIGNTPLRFFVSLIFVFLLISAPLMPSKDPLHGKTLEMIVTELVEHFGWEDLGSIIDIRCFRFDPSIKSSLTFLRKTPWARKKVEELYISIQRE